ncbi:MAG: hypothetical protein JNM19_09255 [Chitinophagaceae bacterium]|nr:hypothetical protein [Chitinophagaceae bacterium]
MFLYKVGKTFLMKEDRCILTPGYSEVKPHENLRFKIGDNIKLVFPDGSIIITKIKGFNLRSPYEILINTTEDIPIGTEVWLTKNEL